MLKRVFCCFLFCLGLSVLCFLYGLPIAHLEHRAYADGGAPNLAYVAGAGGGIGVIDVQLQQMTRTIKLDGDPAAVALSLDGRFLYVAQPALQRLSIIAAKDGSTICTANVPGSPSLIAFDANNKVLYVAGNASATVTKVDPENCTIRQRIQTSGPVYGIALAVTGASVPGNEADQLWVSNANEVSIFRSDTGKQLGHVSLSAGPRNLTIPPGGTVYAITHQGTVVAIDLNTYRVEKLIAGGSYGPMDFNETTGEVYVPDRQNDQLVVLTPVNSGFQLPQEPERVYKINAAPVSVAITNDGQLGFVALNNGNVAMYDLPGRQLITTIRTGGTPRFIITGLYPPAIGTTPAQANNITLLANVAGYGIVLVLVVIPIVLFWRYSRSRTLRE